MNTAKDKTTGEIVEAEELSLLDNVDKKNYECTDPQCMVPLTRAHWNQAVKSDHISLCQSITNPIRRTVVLESFPKV